MFNYDSFSLFALTSDLTANETINLENFLSTVAFNEAFHDIPIFREDFTKKFQEILPRRKDMLLNLIKALQAEDKHSTICSLFLG